VVLPLTSREDLGIIHMMIALFPVYSQVIHGGGLPLHGALLEHPEYGGIGILAPGGTGKTTCSQRVIAPWSSHCDDFFVVIRSRQGYLAHPFPTWSEFLDEQKRRSGPKSWDSEDFTPLKGMYFLQKGKEDDCSVLNRIDAVQWIFDSSTQVIGWLLHDLPSRHQREIKRMIFDNACTLAQDLPAHILHATIDGRFWEKVEENLRERRRDQ
jgi:SynChlorMet cassette protein ScmC